MTADSTRVLATRKGSQWVWFLLPWLAAVYAGAIVFLPFPHSLVVVLAPLLIGAIWYDLRLGIVAWFLLSALGNMFVVDLPGVVPLRSTHLILLLLAAIGFARSYRQVPAALARFLSTPKNRILLILLAWIALSMVMGRLTGVTQQGWRYQFNAWFSVALAILLAFVVSEHTDASLLKAIVWSTVILGTALTLAVLIAGAVDGLRLWGWKAYYYRFLRDTGLVYVSPLYVALVFFADQKWWGKLVFAAAIAVSSALAILMALDGSRSNLFPLVTIGFLLLFSRPRLLLAFVLLVAVPVVVLNAATLESWAGEQMEYTVSEGVVIGKGSRIGLWLDALETIQRHPVWGTGSDFYRLHANVKVIGTDIYYNPVAKWSTDAHNTWLQAAVDHGIPGAVLLAVFFVCLLKDAWSLYRLAGNALYRKYALLFLAGFCTIICTSLVGEAMLPVFTATLGSEESQLARYLVGFWLQYGIFLGIEEHAAVRG